MPIVANTAILRKNSFRLMVCFRFKIKLFLFVAYVVKTRISIIVPSIFYVVKHIVDFSFLRIFLHCFLELV